MSVGYGLWYMYVICAVQVLTVPLHQSIQPTSSRVHLQKALDSLRSLAAFSTRALLCLCSTLPLQLLRPSLISIIGLLGPRRIKHQTRNGLTSLSCCILTCETLPGCVYRTGR